LLNNPLNLRDGMINVSSKPGLGIDVNMETIKKFKTN
jgi:L-alanine-DL-glutamate epimerase-like enolase superfamily enzyme